MRRMKFYFLMVFRPNPQALSLGCLLNNLSPPVQTSNMPCPLKDTVAIWRLLRHGRHGKRRLMMFNDLLSLAHAHEQHKMRCFLSEFSFPLDDCMGDKVAMPGGLIVKTLSLSEATSFNAFCYFCLYLESCTVRKFSSTWSPISGLHF